MKIEKLPSGSYRVRKMIDGKTHSLTFDKKPTQKEIILEINKKMNSSVTMSNAPNKTFKECADKYFEVKKNVLSGATLRSDKSRAENLSDEFKNTLMSNMNNLIIQSEINNLCETKSDKTVRNYFTVIKNVIDFFIKDYYWKVDIPKRKTPKKDYLPTNEDVRRILDASNDKYWIMFMLAAHGLRRSEAIALEYPDDFDAEYNLVHVTKAKIYSDDKEWIIQNYNKTDESTRDVPIPPELIEKIAEQGYVYDGHPRKILEYLNARQKELGIQKFRLHDFRAYFATELDQARFSSKDIQKLGGWSSDSILRTIYMHNRVEQDKKIQQKASKVISKKIK